MKLMMWQFCSFRQNIRKRYFCLRQNIRKRYFYCFLMKKNTHVFNINITKNINHNFKKSKIKMTISMQKKKLEKKLKKNGSINFAHINFGRVRGDISVELIVETMWVKYGIRLRKDLKRHQYVDYVNGRIRNGDFTMEEFITNAFRVAHVDFDDEEEYNNDIDDEEDTDEEEDKKPSGDEDTDEEEDKKPSGDEDVKKADDDVDDKVAAWVNSSITVYRLSDMGRPIQVHPDMLDDVFNHVKPEETDESESDADAVELKALRDCVQAEVREDADVVEMDAVMRALDEMCIHDADAEDAEDPEA